MTVAANVSTAQLPARVTTGQTSLPDASPTRPRRWRWLFLAALIVTAAGGSAAWYFFAHDHEEETQLMLLGNIDVRQVNLSFKVDGRIETLAVDEGDVVRAGRVLATLDKRYFQCEHCPAAPAIDNGADTST